MYGHEFDRTICRHSKTRVVTLFRARLGFLVVVSLATGGTPIQKVPLRVHRLGQCALPTRTIGYQNTTDRFVFAIRQWLDGRFGFGQSHIPSKSAGQVFLVDGHGWSINGFTLRNWDDPRLCFFPILQACFCSRWNQESATEAIAFAFATKRPCMCSKLDTCSLSKKTHTVVSPYKMECGCCG